MAWDAYAQWFMTAVYRGSSSVVLTLKGKKRRIKTEAYIRLSRLMGIIDNQTTIEQ